MDAAAKKLEKDIKEEKAALNKLKEMFYLT